MLSPSAEVVLNKAIKLAKEIEKESSFPELLMIELLKTEAVEELLLKHRIDLQKLIEKLQISIQSRNVRGGEKIEDSLSSLLQRAVFNVQSRGARTVNTIDILQVLNEKEKYFIAGDFRFMKPIELASVDTSIQDQLDILVAEYRDALPTHQQNDDYVLNELVKMVRKAVIKRNRN